MKKNMIPMVVLGVLLLPPLALGQDTGDEGLDEPLASRGDVVVTHREFDARMSLIPEKDRASFLRDGSRLERVLSEMLLQKQLAADAHENGFDQEPVVQDRMQLAAMGELAKAWLDHYVDMHGEADYEAMAREQYLLDPEKYKSKATIDVSHILISTSERSPEEAEALAAEVRSQLAEDPSSWDALVMSYSEDPSVTSNGGSFKGVKKGDMVKNFETAAFAMQPNEISNPVRTQYGYHIIRLDALHEPQPLAFDDVKLRLIDQQRRAHLERIRIDYLNRLGTVETDMTTEGVRKMLLRYVDESALAGQTENDSE